MSAVSMRLFILCCAHRCCSSTWPSLWSISQRISPFFNILCPKGVRLARLDLTATTVSGTTNCHCHASAATNKILSMCVCLCLCVCLQSLSWLWWSFPVFWERVFSYLLLFWSQNQSGEHSFFIVSESETRLLPSRFNTHKDLVSLSNRQKP